MTSSDAGDIFLLSNIVDSLTWALTWTWKGYCYPRMRKCHGIAGSIVVGLTWRCKTMVPAKTPTINKAQNLHFTGFVSDSIRLWNMYYAKKNRYWQDSVFFTCNYNAANLRCEMVWRDYQCFKQWKNKTARPSISHSRPTSFNIRPYLSYI